MSVALKRKSIGPPVHLYPNRSESELSFRIEASRVCPLERRQQQQHQRVTEVARDFSRNVDALRNSEDIVENLENIRTAKLVRGIKRARVSSSSDSSQECDSERSLSPEISYGDSPAAYKLCPLKGEYLVVKLPMNDSRVRRHKCSDGDITRILNSDEENEVIFDGIKKSGGRVVASLLGDVSPTASQPGKATKRPLQRGTPSKNSTAESRDRQASLKIKLRRSTEQSNYKIQEIGEERKCRSSPRSNMGNPKKCSFADCDEDHGVRTQTRSGLEASATGPRTPKVSTRAQRGRPRRSGGASLFNGDDSPESSCGEKAESSKKIVQDTPVTGAGTPRSTRPRRPSVRYNDGLDGETLDKENKSDNDIDDAVDRAGPRTPKVSTRAREGRPRRERRGGASLFYGDDSAESSCGENAESSKKIVQDTPVTGAGTPRSIRPRRPSVRYNDGLDGETLDKENKSDNDIDDAVDRAGPRTPKVSTRPRRERRGEASRFYGDDGAESSSGENAESSKKIVQDTPVAGAGTPRSTRSRRTSVRYNYDLDGETLDKENKSDNDIDDAVDGAGPRRRARPSESEKMKLESPRRGGRTKRPEEPTTPLTPKRNKLTTRCEKAVAPVTPTSSRKRKVETPSMSRRTANIAKPKTILEEARANLHVSALPKSLPCREAEFNDIYQFIERKLLDNNSGCIYISGVPGTGKTATVNEVVRCLNKLVEKGDLDKFDYVEINGMKLSEPRQAYVQILKQMNGGSATWEQAYCLLDKRFARSSSKRSMTLLLVDELDLLCNKRQDVVYNLLDWPAKPEARLIVVTIANTMDLPERALMGRVTSRLGLTRLTFQPYTHKQLQEIVIARLKNSDAFRNEAIELVARKVAAVSGDARRALDICRRATEIAELNNAKCVTMGDVNEALNEMIASSKVQAIQHCSMMEKLFLQSVGVEVLRTGVEETLFQDVYRQLAAMCSFEGLTVPNVSEALAICARLGANRLLLCEHSRIDSLQRILLNISQDDLHFATRKFGSN